MSADLMGYQALMDDAARGVARDVLRKVAADGLPGAHHLFLTFVTGAPGVSIPDALRARYPDEMTIVLQHQYWDLQVEDDGFAVTLTFNKLPSRLEVPFSALKTMVDPHARFGLELRAAASEGAPAEMSAAETPDTPAGGDDTPKTGDVVSLDAFRRKT